ncbi:hypothetical protein TNCV_3672461 [Trichonephila clavipes]|nr:hypothetical protein TNCV_3672461 [Trichonephila clavipes]
MAYWLQRRAKNVAHCLPEQPTTASIESSYSNGSYSVSQHTEQRTLQMDLCSWRPNCVPALAMHHRQQCLLWSLAQWYWIAEE